jgi:hypothetical protein
MEVAFIGRKCRQNDFLLKGAMLVDLQDRKYQPKNIIDEMVEKFSVAFVDRYRSGLRFCGGQHRSVREVKEIEVESLLSTPRVLPCLIEILLDPIITRIRRKRGMRWRRLKRGER